MDPLASVLNEMYLSGEVVSRFDLVAPWGIQMPPRSGIFHAVDEGGCWVRLAADGRLFQVSRGDLVVFPEGAAHDIVDSPDSLAIPLEDALDGRESRSYVSLAGGDRRARRPETSFVCGVFHFRDGGFHAFRSALPPVLHIRGEGGHTTEWLQLALRRLSEEAAAAAPGAFALLSRLTDILFIEGVRAWLNAEEGEPAGWLGALKDPEVSAALARIHGEPDRHWTIAALAEDVALSRSALAERFTRLVGMPPMSYVTSWRMQLARNWLRGTNKGLGEVAAELGYRSEDAFRRAFRREVGVAPGEYRREASADPSP